MEEIRGEKYKLVGIGVLQKGTLVDVFAKFAKVDEDIDDIMSNKPLKNARRKKAKPGTLGSLLDGLKPLPRSALMPTLSAQDIVEAVVGERDLQRDGMSHIELVDNSGVIADLGPGKLAQVLVEMGKVRAQVLEEGQYTFVPLKPKAQTPKAQAPKA